MAIIGTHMLFYTPEAEALRAQIGDILQSKTVDAGHGWLIFALPPAELGVHPSEGTSHEISFMCDDMAATMEELKAKGAVFEGEPVDAGFGITCTMTLAGGLKVLLYEPRHPTAIE